MLPGTWEHAGNVCFLPSSSYSSSTKDRHPGQTLVLRPPPPSLSPSQLHIQVHTPGSLELSHTPSSLGLTLKPSHTLSCHPLGEYVPPGPDLSLPAGMLPPPSQHRTLGNPLGPQWPRAGVRDPCLHPVQHVPSVGGPGGPGSLPPPHPPPSRFRWSGVPASTPSNTVPHRTQCRWSRVPVCTPLSPVLAVQGPPLSPTVRCRRSEVPVSTPSPTVPVQAVRVCPSSLVSPAAP